LIRDLSDRIHKKRQKEYPDSDGYIKVRKAGGKAATWIASDSKRPSLRDVDGL
jgi:hypothetical protein